MRRHLAILRTTALEVCSEPLTFLLTLTALGCAAILPSLHFHQFGESSRMARDAGLSALLIVGLAYSVFCTVKPYRREIESGTLQMALAASVSRPGFFLAKLAGVFLAYLVFAVTVTCVALTAVNGAELGGALAAKTGDIAKMYGPSLSFAVSVLVLPPVLAAALNRFLRFRFVPTATFLSLVLAAGAAAFRFSPHLAARFLPAAVLLVFPAAVFMAAAAAAQLMGGRLELGCEGDLFRATVTLPLAPPQPAAPEAPAPETADTPQPAEPAEETTAAPEVGET